METEAEKCIRFIERLKLVGSSSDGKPFILRDWQKEIIRGLLDPKTFTAYISYGRKGGKSQLIAAIALYFLVGSGRTGQSIYIGAAKRDQALYIWKMIAGFIRQSKALQKILTVQRYKYRIAWEAKGNEIIALASDGQRDEGAGPTVVIIDELALHKDSQLYDSLSSSFGATDKPLLIVITTAGTDRESKAYELYQYAKRWKENPSIDDHFYAQLHEVPITADWTKEENWFLAMPGLGDFTNLDFIRAQFKLALQNKSEERKFRQKYLNQWQSKYIQSWLSMNDWDQLPKPNGFNKQGRWTIGVDMAAVCDLASVVLYSPDTHTVFPHFFTPNDSRELYKKWAGEHFITVTNTAYTDQKVIKQTILDLCSQYNVETVAFDKWNSFQLINELEDEGIPAATFSQSFADYNEPSKRLERLVLGHDLQVDHPVLSWQASNCVVKVSPEGNIKPDKEKSLESIDGIAALIMAIGAAMEPEIRSGIDI